MQPRGYGAGYLHLSSMCPPHFSSNYVFGSVGLPLNIILRLKASGDLPKNVKFPTKPPRGVSTSVFWWLGYWDGKV